MHKASLAWMVVVAAAGCAPSESDLPLGERRQALCNPGDMGGDLGCNCTDNAQCNNFDNDTRLIICDVPGGATVGTCLDCAALMQRPEGCFCSVDMDCQTGLYCDVNTCQKKRNRGEFCLLDAECGTDMTGAMSCLPTKHWCGPTPDGYPCDFVTDCLSRNCVANVCSSGGGGFLCNKDADCAPPLVCNALSGTCKDKQPDGTPCIRNQDCVNQCNSFSGRCLQGVEGVLCTRTGNGAGADADCQTGLQCTDCMNGQSTCRMPGSPCR